MKKVEVPLLKPGMRLAKTIYNKEGMVLLYEGIKLTESYIRSLKNQGIKSAYVDKSEKMNLIQPEIISEHVKQKAYTEIFSFIERIINRKAQETKKIKNHVERLLSHILEDPIIILYMVNLFFFDDYTFNHSLHVSYLSILLGAEIGLKQDDLMDLGRGALLHDIGKMKIPREIFNKPGILDSNELTIIRKHTIQGYNMIRKKDYLSPEASSILLSHHERIDGTGYPQHIQKKEIHIFNRIVALADVFDAISSDRVYKKGMDYYSTVEVLKKISDFLKEPLLPHFLKHIAVYPIGTEVYLNNGYRGIVVEKNLLDPKNPAIELIQDHRGNQLKRESILDLKRERNLFIKTLARNPEQRS